MRILEIVSATRINGAIKHCHDLTLQLRDRGHDMYMACLPDSWIGKQMESRGIPTIETDMHRWPYDQFHRVAEFIHENEIDVVHTHMSRAHFFGVLLKWFVRTPIVATAHSRLFQLHWRWNDKVIAVSDATKEFQVRRNFVRRDRIETIHNFVQKPSSTKPDRDAREAFLKQEKIDPQHRIITFVGEITSRKGLIFLVEAFPQILQQHPDTTLLVVGPATERECKARFCRLARKLGVLNNMHFLGRRSDVSNILSISDIFVLPSLEESFPLTILEAMGAKLPVVATAVGGVAECVIDGQTGFTVPSKNPAQLADRLSLLLADKSLRERMGQNGFRSVFENFSVASQIPKIENVFAGLIGDAPAKRWAA